jgi:hypothetical protein
MTYKYGNSGYYIAIFRARNVPKHGNSMHDYTIKSFTFDLKTQMKTLPFFDNFSWNIYTTPPQPKENPNIKVDI